VEVYCNGQWGTICDDGFGATDANTVCKQLGYSTATNYNHLASLYIKIVTVTYLKCLILGLELHFKTFG
jgi:hypothetical protein